MSHMRRINVYIDPNQAEYLDNLSGTLSEHIRSALDTYIAYHRNRDAATSQSKPTKMQQIIQGDSHV